MQDFSLALFACSAIAALNGANTRNNQSGSNIILFITEILLSANSNDRLSNSLTGRLAAGFLESKIYSWRNALIGSASAALRRELQRVKAATAPSAVAAEAKVIRPIALFPKS